MRWRSVICLANDAVPIWIKQIMGVKDEITHMRIIDCALRGRFPGFARVFEIGICADEIDSA